ncbi:unnamed protein product [Candidula unifasciata]|uniref:Profilin n=1 Tax=Candidula unifasciata TaxID=100452 RepID=A0A8S3YUZ6_9EUPU|nr:unnamed protein product [Candidula unifasciata]
MSWAPYVETLEKGKGRCKYAGIFGISPVSPWAESANKESFPITVDDVSNLIRVIKSQDMNVMASGVRIGGNLSFTCLRLEPNILVMQGKGDNKDYSVVVALSNQACIIGFNPDADIKAAQVRDSLEQLRDHLCAACY